MASEVEQLVELMERMANNLDGVIREHGAPIEEKYALLDVGERKRRFKDDMNAYVDGLFIDMGEFVLLARKWSIWQDANEKDINDAFYCITPFHDALLWNQDYLAQLDNRMKMKVTATLRTVNQLYARLELALKIWQAERRHCWNTVDVDRWAGLTNYVGKIKRCQVNCGDKVRRKLLWVVGATNDVEIPEGVSAELVTEVIKNRDSVAAIAIRLNHENLKELLSQAETILKKQIKLGRPSQPVTLTQSDKPV